VILWRYHQHVRGCLHCTGATDRPDPRTLSDLCATGRKLWREAQRATGARWHDNLPPDPTKLLRNLPYL
jgi:hypothetical protein